MKQKNIKLYTSTEEIQEIFCFDIKLCLRHHDNITLYMSYHTAIFSLIYLMTLEQRYFWH